MIKSKKQGVVFGLIMSYAMAIGMEVYNVAIKQGGPQFPGEHPAAVQIFGSDPVCMAEAAQIAMEHTGADILDINMGCPMGKIVNNGDGAALMKDPELAGRIVFQSKEYSDYANYE